MRRLVRIACEFDVFHAGDLLSPAYQARIHPRLPQRGLKFSDDCAQSRVLLKHKAFITLPCESIASARCEHDRRDSKTCASDDQA
jgi:hypothetical protein